MYFRIISHACMLVESDSLQILTDPWIIGSSYWRSWWNYPPVRKEDYNKIIPDYIILTHIHWDHFHSPSLKYFGKNTKIIIPYDRYSRTLRDLNKIGFKNVIEIKNFETLSLSKNFKITSYQFAPTCTDSAILFESKGVKMLNLNDCKIFGSPLNRILKMHNKIDFVFKSHSSANSRICYNPDKNIKFDNKERYFNQFYEVIKKIKPKYAVPFASNTCYLHEETFKYNDFSNSPYDLEKYFNKKDNIKTELKVMIRGSAWSNSSGFNIEPYKAWFEKKDIMLEEYINSVQNKLKKQYSIDFNSKISFKLIENYFGKFFKNLNFILRIPLRGNKIYFRYYNGYESNYCMIDVYKKICKEAKHKDYELAKLKFDIPNVVLKMCIKLNMFSHGFISKRITFYSDPGDERKLKYFEYLLEMTETELIPFKNNFSLRSLKNWSTRLSEIILYIRVLLIMKLKNKSKDEAFIYCLHN